MGDLISVVEPAAVATNIAAGTDTDALVRPGDPYRELGEKFLGYVDQTFAIAQPAREAAAVVVEVATTSTPRFRWQTSDSATASVGLSLADLDGSNVVDAMSGTLGGSM